MKHHKQEELFYQIPPPPRDRRTGQAELLLQYVENLAGRSLSGYESRLLLTIVDSIIAEMKEDSGNVSG